MLAEVPTNTVVETESKAENGRDIISMNSLIHDV